MSTGTNLSSEGLDARRRRLLFRCWHRGIREMDLVLGRFADAKMASLSDTEVEEIERWLDVPDQRIFAWVNGMEPVPSEFDTALFRRLRNFNPRACVIAAGKSPAALLKPGKPLILSQVADGAEGPCVCRSARAIAARKNAPAISLAVVCRDGQRMAALSLALTFFAPEIQVLEFPAWDCLPYDRVSPNAALVAPRMTALSRLARVRGRDKPRYC